MHLDALMIFDAEALRRWRNQDIAAYRTPFRLTAEMQENWYLETVCDREAPHRYWGVYEGTDLVGVVGLVNIEWENKTAELSIVIDPDRRFKGRGEESLKMLLREAFMFLGLNTVYGECYKCSPSITFWRSMINKYALYSTMLPDRKFSDGIFWDSVYFVFRRDSVDYP